MNKPMPFNAKVTYEVDTPSGAEQLVFEIHGKDKDRINNTLDEYIRNAGDIENVVIERSWD